MDDNDVDPSSRDIGQHALEGGALQRAARYTAIVIVLTNGRMHIRGAALATTAIAAIITSPAYASARRCLGRPAPVDLRKHRGPGEDPRRPEVQEERNSAGFNRLQGTE